MVKSFPESVAVVAVVGSKDVGQSIALRLEHQAAAVILGKDLVEHRRAGVGRDDERPALGDLGRQLQGVLLFLALVFGLGFPVLGHLFGVDAAQSVLDGLHQAPAKRQPAFARRRRSGDKEEEVGVHRPVSVHAVQVGEAGRQRDNRAENQQIRIFVGVGVGGNLVQRGGKLAPDILREGRHPLFPHSLKTLNPSRRGFHSLGAAYADAVLVGKVEQRLRPNPFTLRAHALVILFVGLRLAVARVDAGYAVEEAASVFAQGGLQRKANLQPLVIVARDIHPPCLNDGRQKFNLIQKSVVTHLVMPDLFGLLVPVMPGLTGHLPRLRLRQPIIRPEHLLHRQAGLMYASGS